MNSPYESLDFAKILDMLCEHAVSDTAKRELAALAPCMDERLCARRMEETSEARALLDACGSPPLAVMKDLDAALSGARIGAMLTPEALSGVAVFCVSCRRMAAYLARGASQNSELALRGREIEDLGELQREIERCVDEEQVRDDASPALRALRRQRESLEARVKEKLAQVLKSRAQYLADSYITQRNGRYVLPVQKRWQTQFGGTVIDASSKGGTVFMEPTCVASLQSEIDQCAVSEDMETRRILYALTAYVAEYADAAEGNAQRMASLDALFAKAKLGAQMKARAVVVSGERRICLRQARHPLLDAQSCVPLDFEMDEGVRGVIITGPNTGGKTVSVKTVGLLTLMAQCGLHIPCEEGGRVAMQDQIFCDIGDSQSISQNLSTFSGHMSNVIRALEGASRDSLVLLDELGSGTDPAEGMGIAVAVLEELRARGCMFLVTTHYPQVKRYAERAEGIQSARMAFDRETLRPLYRLEMGKSGESCALYIAQRLGLPAELAERARREAYGGAVRDAAPVMPAPRSRLTRLPAQRPVSDISAKFSMGDSVQLLPGKENAIVYRPADEMGEVVIQIKGEKRRVNHKRLKLLVPASELYPDDYDFSILFDSVENRKASRVLGKRYDPTVVITREPEA